MFKLEDLKKYLLELYKDLQKEFQTILEQEELGKSVEKIFKSYEKKNSIAGMETVLLSFNEYLYFREAFKELYMNRQNFQSFKFHMLKIFKEDFSDEDYRFYELERSDTNYIDFANSLKKIQDETKKNLQKVNKDLISNKDFLKIYKQTDSNPITSGLNIKFIEKPTPIEKIKQFTDAEILLKEIWEEGFELYKVLTLKINFVQSQNLVSYSHFNEQGVSYINIIDRTILETVDDLIHENSHHYLNLIIKKFKLLKKEKENRIYYSTWRKELRPLYAILHSVFTFSYGAELFSKFIEKLPSLKNKFNAEEISFIHRRFFEETLMIEYSTGHLDFGLKKKYFTPKGIQVIEAIKSMNSKHLSFMKKLNQKILLEEDKQIISSIKKEISTVAKIFKLE